jgi:hypothetical protein
MTDSFRMAMALEPRAIKMLNALDDVCDRTQNPAVVRGTLNVLSWSLRDATLRAAPRHILLRAAAMAQQYGACLGADHGRVLETIQDHAEAVKS